MNNVSKYNKLIRGFCFLAVFFMLVFIPCNTSVVNAVDTVKNDNQIEMATKIPIGKSVIAMKFLLAMLGVAVSSVVIFVLLSLYNKYFYSGNTVAQDVENADNDFKTPVNMKDALAIFLKKTK